MWTTGLNFILWVLGLFGFGKTDERDTERAAGEKLGVAETSAAGNIKELNNAKDAADAGRSAAAADDAGGVRIKHPGDRPWNPDGIE